MSYSSHTVHVSTPQISKLVKLPGPVNQIFNKDIKTIFPSIKPRACCLITNWQQGFVPLNIRLHAQWSRKFSTSFMVQSCSPYLLHLPVSLPRDCAKILTKLKQNNNHCSSLDISSQKAISYSAIRSSGISIFLLSFLFLCKENSANKSHKEIKAPLFPFDINHEQHWNVNKAQAAFFLPEKKLSITNVHNSGERRLLVLIPLPWNCKGHQGTLSEISSASNSMFLPWGNR